MIQLTGHRQARQLLRTLRQRQGVTQDSLARRVYVTRAAVNYRESGRSRLTTDVLIDTARALGYRVALIRDPQPGRRTTGTGWPA